MLFEAVRLSGREDGEQAGRPAAASRPPRRRSERLSARFNQGTAVDLNHQHRRSPLRQGHEPSAAGADPGHARRAQGVAEPAGRLARTPASGTVAYHVRTLLQLGLIELVDETRVRGAVEHHYRAVPRPTVTRRGVGAGLADRQAGRGRLVARGDRRVRAAVGRRRRLRPLARHSSARRCSSSTRRASRSSRRRARSCSSGWRRSRPTPPSGSAPTRTPRA